MTHHAVSSRESMILMSSPLRRKSMLNLSSPDGSLRQNDDDAERLERRRNAELEMRQRDSPSPVSESRRSIGGGAISGLSAAQLAEHYANCIKLSAENKINTKNAFSLQLIDYMAIMLKKRDSKMDNFQVASCTLDASTKIYAYRVDSVHMDVLKMAGGLAVGNRKKQRDGEDDGDMDGGGDADEDDEINNSRIKKKKTRKNKKTIAANVESLNGKVELQQVMDPFFLRASGNGDSHPGDCRFLTNLKILSNCALNLYAELPFWESLNDSAKLNESTVPLPFLPDLNGKRICPTFENFSFTTWNLESENENCDTTKDAPPLPPDDDDDDYAFDVNAVPEPVPDDCENDHPMNQFDISGIEQAADSDGEPDAQPIACRPKEKTSTANIIDLRKHLSLAPSEYSYFRAGAFDLWAGPSHWKVRPIRSMDWPKGSGIGASEAGEEENQAPLASKKGKHKQKKELILEYNVEDLFPREQNPQVLKLTKRTMQRVWSGDKNTNPPDLHFNIPNFFRLELRKSTVVKVSPDPYEDDQPSGYDYENDHDTSEYCPNVPNDDGDEGDDGIIDDIPMCQDVHNSIAVEVPSQLDAFTGDNLVAPPNKVARIFIPYAMRAKKVDMRKLKIAIWNILTDADNKARNLEEENLQVDVPVTFRELYTKLPLKLSSMLAENLSVSLALVALLHLANENNLHIEHEDDLGDLIISQP